MFASSVLLPLLFVLIFLLGRISFARYDSDASWKWAIGLMMTSMVIATTAFSYAWLIVAIAFAGGMVTKTKNVTIGW